MLMCINAVHVTLQAKKHLGPKLIDKAAEMGIEIRPVHVGRPLEEQGPFDILLHKVRRKGERPDAPQANPDIGNNSARLRTMHEAKAFGRHSQGGCTSSRRNNYSVISQQANLTDDTHLLPT
jgi:hypothetical protein